MEVTGSIELYGRSVDLYNVRYLFYSGDGGSKTCVSINEAQVNGPDIDKLECMYRPHAEAHGHPASENAGRKNYSRRNLVQIQPSKDGNNQLLPFKKLPSSSSGYEKNKTHIQGLL